MKKLTLGTSYPLMVVHPTSWRWPRCDITMRNNIAKAIFTINDDEIVSPIGRSKICDCLQDIIELEKQ